MIITVDAYGGDNCPKAAVEGALSALLIDSELKIKLVGNKAELEQLVNAEGGSDRIEIINSEEIITCEDSPAEVIREKPNSSMVVALSTLKGDSSAVVSAGSTGALLAGGIMKVGRIRGIHRPALCTVLPTANGGDVVFLDCGANSECTEKTLVGFAAAGKIYSKTVLGNEQPKIGLLNNGTEKTKGMQIHRDAYEILSNDEPLFVGNVEGRDILSGKVDVVVADGFSGNVAIKTMEGTASTIFKILKSNIKSGGFKAKIGALLLKSALKNTAKALDYTERGGAVLLGLKGIVVKTHGASDKKAFAATILQARDIAKGDFCAKCAQALGEE